MRYQAVSLLDAHTWTKSCRLILQPKNGFEEQLIYCEFQLLARTP